MMKYIHAYIACSILFLQSLVANYMALAPVSATNFNDEFYAPWASDHIRILNQGKELQLFLDETSGSRFASKGKYLFGNISMKIRLVPGDSAGTVTAYYLSSESVNHDELDFEFLGNVSGQPYVLQTNIYAEGSGGREQRIYLWFDPTVDFHSYGVQWNRAHVIFMVDDVPIRVYPNLRSMGIAYPDRQPMAVFSSIWNGDDWATRGGLVKVDWSHAPFVASYIEFHTEANCEWNTHHLNSTRSPPCASPSTEENLRDRKPCPFITSRQQTQLEWVKKNYMIYDYCEDTSRYPSPPTECKQHIPLKSTGCLINLP